MMKRWIIALLSVLMFAACTKDGDTIYQPDPDEPKASTAPLVTVIIRFLPNCLVRNLLL